MEQTNKLAQVGYMNTVHCLAVLTLQQLQAGCRSTLLKLKVGTFGILLSLQVHKTFNHASLLLMSFLNSLIRVPCILPSQNRFCCRKCIWPSMFEVCFIFPLYLFIQICSDVMKFGLPFKVSVVHRIKFIILLSIVSVTLVAFVVFIDR